MPVVGAIVVLIQFCFAFHVLKSGRPYWWIFIIMAFPVMGCVIYYFVEVFPGSREHRRANKVARSLARVLQPDAQLKKRAEELEVCGSVDNKIALAVECTSHQMYEEAIRLYESCLQGPYAADGTILFGLARAAVEAGDLDKAGPALYKLKTDAPKVRPLDVRLLQARVLEARGETDAALAMFRELIPVFVGLEASYRYGEMLLRLGKQEAAMEMFNQAVRHSKRFTSAVEDEERWASAARQAISGA